MPIGIASISSFIAGRPADVLSRPHATALGAGIIGLGAALQVGSVNIPMFIAGRVIEGLGIGVVLWNLDSVRSLFRYLKHNVLINLDLATSAKFLRHLSVVRLLQVLSF